MKWGVLALFLSGCFGCEQETRPEPEARQMVGAWGMKVGRETEIVTFSAPVRTTETTVTYYENGKLVRREVRK